MPKPTRPNGGIPSLILKISKLLNKNSIAIKCPFNDKKIVILPWTLN